MFEPYIANPGTYDRSDLLLSLARIHPESKFLVKIDLHGDISRASGGKRNQGGFC